VAACRQPSDGLFRHAGAVTSPPEQQALIEHSPHRHGVVLAGPGTGKSTTVLRLVARLADEEPSAKVKVITFTRAATAELVAKIRDEGHGLVEPSTVHAFALSLLMRNPGHAGLPEPLRIPDDWETKNLLYPDLSRRLKAAGWQKATPTMVGKLVREMAAGWETLDPDVVLLVDVDTGLRNRFRAAWLAQRNVVGYSLFAEMPFRTREVLEDLPDVDLGDLALLVVDEFQDLNRADIALVEAVASRSVAVLAVGDDDQSIYSWRFASPHGIRAFHANPAFPAPCRYTLSTSYRCGAAILAAARELIEASPGRPPKPSLKPGPNNPAGTVTYLRFSNESTERAGAVRLIHHLVDHELVPADQIVVLVRGDAHHTWSGPLRDALVDAGIPAIDVESVLEPLSTGNARKLLALARVVDDAEDNLAWWSLLHLEKGIADAFPAAVADAASESGERFNSRLLRLDSAPLGVDHPVSSTSVNKALSLIERVLRQREQATTLPKPDPDPDNHDSWTDWLLALADLAELPVAEDLRTLLLEAGDTITTKDGLRHYLDAVEPAARDLALETPGVAIMSMARSKGLTRTAAVVMGVEAGIIPSPREGVDEEEERRLLYVAMTRARQYLYLTMATTRTGPTAFAGGGQAGSSRSRCPFFAGTQMSPQPGETYLATLGA